MNIAKQKKIKVLLIVCNNVLNGTERYVVDLASNLPREKFDVYVATPKYGPLSEVLKKRSIKELIFNNGRTLTYSVKGLNNLRYILRKEKFDILHANSGFLPCVVGKFVGVKFIIEVKHGIFYSKKQLDTLPFVRRVYERNKKRFVDKFIATSPNDKNLMMKHFHIPENMIEIIYLGLDIKELKNKVSEEPLNYKSKDFVFGHIGRLTYQKAQIILFKAFKILSEKYSNIKLEIIGDGEDKVSLQKFINENDLGSKIIFRGYIDDIYNEMKKFDAHVLTSRFEGMGYVNLEAMALNVPVITSDVGGATNFLKNGFNALITPVDDPQETADAMEKLLTNDKLRTDIIKNAAETVKKYSIEKMVKDTSDFYIRNLK